MCVDQLKSGFLGKMGEEFKSVYDSLMTYNDEFFVLKDFRSYIEMHEKLQTLYLNQDDWNQISLVNIAQSGVFSSDRSIREYAARIWKIQYRSVNNQAQLSAK